MTIISKGRFLLKGVVNRQLKGALLNSCRHKIQYVNPQRYELDDVTVVQDEDPLSAKVIEKHGKAWHILNESKKSSIAHTVSSDFDLYNGLHRRFYLEFYKQTDFEELKNKKYPIGSVAAINNGNHFVYFLIIRENWWDRGAYRPMRESLQAMRDHAIENDVPNITMGRLGTHDDGLDFTEVYKDARKIFYNSGISLTFYVRQT